jgi:hypothetical protein
MFRKYIIGNSGDGVSLYIQESNQAYEIQLEKEAECEEAVWCNKVTGNSPLTVGLGYHIEENEKVQNAIKRMLVNGTVSLWIILPTHGHHNCI